MLKKKASEDKKNSPETPYLAARREWNERYGDIIKTGNNWRVAFFCALGVSLVTSGGLVAVSMKSQVIPYAVETNQFGEISRVTKMNVASSPTEVQTRAAVRDWIIGARTVYVDLRAEKDVVDRTYSMTLPDSPAYQNLAMYHRENDPYRRSINETVEVEVKAAIPVSPESWQVEWTETIKQRSGKVVSVKNWQATLTLTIAAPSTEQQILSNPLGLYVRQFAWTTRI